ncbi:protein of unknown function [Hyphomicrobium sp. 1Nfss2.1]
MPRRKFDVLDGCRLSATRHCAPPLLSSDPKFARESQPFSSLNALLLTRLSSVRLIYKTGV